MFHVVQARIWLMQEILIGVHKKNQADFLELLLAIFPPAIFGIKVQVSTCFTGSHRTP
jgi:hypothetical protein